MLPLLRHPHAVLFASVVNTMHEPSFAIVAGEASGDILGADLIRALKKRYPDAQFYGVGGQKMIAEGFESFYPMERLSVMGLVEPLKRLPELLAMRADLKQRFIKNRPLAFIGIDSPDFVMNIEAAMKDNGIASIHYVSPSVWAWRKNRIHKIKRSVDLMLTLFPFELPIYEENAVPAVCVGHPLADQIGFEQDQRAARTGLNLPIEGRYVALMPGSRRSEIEALLPRFLEAFSTLRTTDSTLQALLPVAADYLQSMIDEKLSLLATDDRNAVHVFQGASHEIMVASDAVLLSSGTATLEAMLLNRPMVVVYRMGGLSYAILSRLVKTPFISLPNLLAQRALVPELIQDAASKDNIVSHLNPLLEQGAARQDTLQTFAELHQMLRKGAGETAAAAIQSLLEQ